MNKTKSKIKGVFKGVAAGFALIMCSAFFPANAVSALAENWEGETKVNTNANRIQVGKEGESSTSTVKKGDPFTIPVGEYYGKSSTAQKIGSSSLANSSIVVTYQATGEEVVETISGKSDDELESLTFTAEKLGTYVITYKVQDGEQEYTYDMSVVCQASEASFEFKTNDENVIPSVYDTKIAKSKNIVLPLPVVNDEDGEEILTGKDNTFYVTDKLGSGIDDKSHYVYVSVTNEKLAIEKDKDGSLYIDGQTITDNAEELDGQEIKIVYSFYEKKGDKGVYITSTSKTFTVEDGYYYLDSDKNEDKTGYEIEASWATSAPDSAVVGVEKTLPTVSAKTKAANYPASEKVNVYYDIQVMKMDEDGKYTIPVEGAITDGSKFIAKEEGSYKFTYIVKDFYGNEASTVNTTFTIDKVKDTQSASVYMYDAGDYTVDADGAYSTAETKLKTQTETRNIIMYAIAGSDNMVESEDIELRREIRDASSIKRFVIGEKDYQEAYNAYNLIFAPNANGTSSVYTQIVNDNYEIYKQMIMDKDAGVKLGEDEIEVDPTSAESVKLWLAENNYLLVTTKYNEDVDGKKIAGEPAGDSDNVANEDIQAMIDAGYAYIPSEASDKQYEFTAQSYSFYYFANDNVNSNKEKSEYHTVKLTDNSSDSSVPTLTFSTDLQNVYLPDETIEFKVATASDTVDTAARLDVVTAYRFLSNATTRTPVESTSIQSTLSYVIKGQVNSKDENKWYVTSQDTNGLVKSEGWYVDQDKATYSVNLANAPAEAKYIEILCYAVDDYGNVGFFNKVIQIADAEDIGMPTLYKVVNIPQAAYTAPDTITLPTLYYTDSKAEYMHAEVAVYKVTTTTDGQGVKKFSRKLMQSSGMATDFDSIRGIYTVDAGIFNASTEGNYQVAVTVKDSGNHSITTYFNYAVAGGQIIEDPEIENISSESQSLAVDESLYLVPPTVSVTKSESYGYIGLDEDDDLNSATYYTTTMVSASTNNYELDKYYFTPKAKGTYKLQYNVFLIRYATSALSAGTVKLDGEQLIYVEGGEEYYVYYEKNEEGKYQLHFNTDPLLSGEATELADTTKADKVITGFSLTSNVQTITVDTVVVKSLSVGDAYQKTQYTTIGTELPIVKPEVVVSGKGSVNLEDSTVQISVTTGSTTQTLATINFAEWQEKVANDSNFTVDGSSVKLKLSKNGKYTIKYSVQAQDEVGQNVGDPKTLEYTISNGDVVSPEIEFDDNFVQASYNLGDELVINMAGLTVNDKVTSDTEKLLETITVKLTNEDTDESWTLENTAEEGKYSFEKKLETAGDYTLTITIRDEAGNKAEKSVSFTVSTEKTSAVNSKDVLGGVLIGVSVGILVGVVAYFVVSKVKLDRKEKGYSSNKKRK